MRRRPAVVDLATQRLHDKSSQVRKRAMQLLVTLLRTHPFCKDGGELQLSVLEVQIEAKRTELAVRYCDARAPHVFNELM